MKILMMLLFLINHSSWAGSFDWERVIRHDFGVQRIQIKLPELNCYHDDFWGETYFSLITEWNLPTKFLHHEFSNLQNELSSCEEYQQVIKASLDADAISFNVQSAIHQTGTRQESGICWLTSVEWIYLTHPKLGTLLNGQTLIDEKVPLEKCEEFFKAEENL